MPKQKTDDLIQLIRSLSRAEKRHFRLFVRRNQASDEILFLQLFDVLDKSRDYDEEMILKKLPAVKKRQLSNLKAHLYKQLLISLRLLKRNHIEDIQLREMIDYAHVLYQKGLYRQSLDMLDKAKNKARLGKFQILNLEILEFEKYIEAQYVTRSIEGRAEELAEETVQLFHAISEANLFSNLSLQLYGLYLKVGYVRNQKDYLFIKEFFSSNLPRIKYEDLDFFGRIYYCQAHLWYYHISQDFLQAYRYAQRWVDLFHTNEALKGLNVPLYLKGLHNLLGVLFNLLHYERFIEVLEELYRFPEQYHLNQSKNVEGLFFLYRYLHTIKKHFIEGTFSEGTHLMPELLAVIESERYNWDSHRVLVFYYQIACMYFGSGDNDRAIDYLNLIINQKNPDYREDIQCFARILSLIAHFEIGNASLVEYQVKSVYRFLSKMDDLHAVQREIFRFLRRLPRIRESELRKEFIILKNKLLEAEKDPFEKRPFLYLDIISWLRSKIENRSVQEVIRQNFLERQGKPTLQ